ncbi:hypothetical protein HDU86_001709 [Geranomyces michiganensis]|nr:hypothetical protein HDU86_001709 [Geranomyces michiganensis]
MEAFNLGARARAGSEELNDFLNLETAFPTGCGPPLESHSDTTQAAAAAEESGASGDSVGTQDSGYGLSDFCHYESAEHWPQVLYDDPSLSVPLAEPLKTVALYDIHAAEWGPGLVDPCVFSQPAAPCDSENDVKDTVNRDNNDQDISSPQNHPPRSLETQCDEDPDNMVEVKVKREPVMRKKTKRISTSSAASKPAKAVKAPPSKRSTTRKRRRVTSDLEAGEDGNDASVTTEPDTGHDETASLGGEKSRYSLDDIGHGIDDLRKFVEELENDPTITPKEKRQLRNKLSARNFRVRRKEYVTQLELQLKEMSLARDALAARNKELENENRELTAKLAEMSLRTVTSSRTSSPTDSLPSRQRAATQASTPPFPYRLLQGSHIQVHTVHVPEPVFTCGPVSSSKAAAAAFLDFVARVAVHNSPRSPRVISARNAVRKMERPGLTTSISAGLLAVAS